MAYRLSERSLVRLRGVHPDLIAVVKRAIALTTVDFAVLEGARTPEKQAQLVAAGASQTLNSRHVPSYCRLLGREACHAVDLGAWVDGAIRWDWPLYHKIADAMKEAASELDVPIVWGGDWKRFKDGPHYQLPWGQYP